MLAKKKYNRSDLWGADNHNKILAMTKKGRWDTDIPPLECAVTLYEAATLAFSLTQRISDEEAKTHLLQEDVLSLYDNASHNFMLASSNKEAVNDPKVLQKWIESAVRCADLFILTKVNTPNIDPVKDLLKAADSLIDTMGIEYGISNIFNYAKSLCADITNKDIILKLYDHLLIELDKDFYADAPNKNILELFRIISEEMMFLAANLNTDDFEERRARMNRMINHCEKFKDTTALENHISYAGDPNPKHPTLRRLRKRM